MTTRTGASSRLHAGPDRGLAQLGRLRPRQALQVTDVGRQGDLARGERLECVLVVGADRPLELDPPLLLGRVAIPDHRIVVAADRQLLGVGVRVAVGEPDGLIEVEPAPRARPAGEELGDRAVDRDVALRRVVGAARDGVDQLADVHALPPHVGGRAREPLAGVAGAVRRAPAGDLDALVAGLDQARIPGVLTRHRVGPVEDERVEAVGVAEGVGLAEVGAEGVAVEGDPLEAQRGADVVDVIGGGAGGVRLPVVAEAAGTLGDRDPLRSGAALDVGAADRPRAAGAAHVDEDELAMLQQVPEQADVGVAAATARVPGPALDGEDRAPRRRLAIVALAHGEADLEFALLRRRPELRDLDRPAAEVGADPRSARARAQLRMLRRARATPPPQRRRRRRSPRRPRRSRRPRRRGRSSARLRAGGSTAPYSTVPIASAIASSAACSFSLTSWPPKPRKPPDLWAWATRSATARTKPR